MTKPRMALLTAITLCALGSVSRATGQTGRRVWQAPGLPNTVTLGASPESAVFAVPAVQKMAGSILALKLVARMNTTQPSGWGNYLGVSIDGKPVGPERDGGVPRLLNRSPLIRLAGVNDYPTSLFQSRGSVPALQVMFAPDSDRADSRVLTDRDRAFTYLLDVDDLIRPNQPASLSVTDLAVRSLFGNSPPAGLALVVEQLELIEIPHEQADLLRRGPVYSRPPAGQGVSISAGQVTVTAMNGGGLQVDVGGDRYWVESELSYAGEQPVAFNRLSADRRSSGESGWSPRWSRSGENLRLDARGRGYSLTRTVAFQGGTVVITDRLSNDSNDAAGTAIVHRLVSETAPERRRLAGVERDSLSPREWAENPTAYLEQKDSFLAARIDDSVLRLQFGAERRGNEIDMAFNHVGLAAGASRDMKWRLFTSALPPSRQPADGFFTFINAARADWNANFTVQGPFEFVDADRIVGPEGEAYLSELIDRKGVKIFGLLPWFEYYSSADMTRDQYKALAQKAMAAIKRKDPAARCIGLVESNLTRFPLSFFGSDVPADLPYGVPGYRLPRGNQNGKYPLAAPTPMAARLEASPWKDSLERDAAGVPLVDTRYVQHYEGKAINLVVYPKRGNYWDSQMLDRIRFLLDDARLDGVYFDQFSFGYDLKARFIPEPWDGATVDLDATGKVARKYGDLGLITSEARRGWIESVLSRGKIVVANTNPAVTEEQSLPTFRFMETQGYDPLAPGVPDPQMGAKGQLASPLGLGTGDAQRHGAHYFNRSVIAQLRYGLLYYYYRPAVTPSGPDSGGYGAVSHMFPFTPISLGEGFAIGKERIVTAVSRAFTRPSGARPRVTVFDEDGRVVANPTGIAVEAAGDGYRVDVKLLDWRQIAVIE